MMHACKLIGVDVAKQTCMKVSLLSEVVSFNHHPTEEAPVREVFQGKVEPACLINLKCREYRG